MHARRSRRMAENKEQDIVEAGHYHARCSSAFVSAARKEFEECPEEVMDGILAGLHVGWAGRSGGATLGSVDR
jgi:hypothetical protein